MAEKPEPVKALYCGVCGLPAEYCEFGPEFDKCKPWLIQNAPDLYPDLPKDDADVVSEQLQSTSISSSSGASSTPKPEEVKRLPGGKVKKKERKEVIIEKVVRNKRKCITTVKGLELFAVKLSDASKKLGKKFATGASVVKGPTEKEQIDVQGDISFDVVEFITDTIPPFSSFASKLQYQYSTSWVVKLLHYSGYWHRLVSLFLHRNVDEYALNGENILLPYFWMQKHELRKFTARPIRREQILLR